MDAFEKSVKRTNVAIFIIATVCVCFALTGFIGLPYLAARLTQHLERCVP